MSRERLAESFVDSQDKTAAQLLYLPREGEDMSTATAILAVEETLLEHNASARHVWSGWVFISLKISTRVFYKDAFATSI